MDLFAVILVTITAITICGICLFIFVCALQPKILRKIHGTSADIDDEEAGSNQSLDDDDQPSVKSDETHENQLDGETSGRNKKEFLKDLEKSLRTGRPIRPEGEGEEEQQNSPSESSNYFSRWIRKWIR